MTLIMILIIYIGSLCLLSCYNFFKIGHFWRTNYSALNRKWFFLYSLIIEGVVLILLPHIRYLFNEPYVNVNDTLRMYKNDDIRMYNFDCITDTIVEVITTCNTYTLLTVHLL